MRERRRVQRKHLMYYTRIFNDDTGGLVGNLVDITPQGTMIISEMPIPVGKEFRFRMELSDDVADKPHLVFKAQSLWCQPDVVPRYHNTGFKLIDVAPGDVEIIQRIVEMYGFRNG